MSDGKVVYTSDVMGDPHPVAPLPSPPFLPHRERGKRFPHSSTRAVPPQTHAFAAATSDGRVMLKSMGFGVSFQGSERVVTPDETPPVFLDLDPLQRPLGPFAAQLDADGNALAAAALADGRLAVVRRASTKNEITGETTASLSRAEVAAPGRITALVIDPQKNLYAGTAGGDLLWWPLDGGQPGELPLGQRRRAGHRAEPAARRPLARRRPGERRALGLVRRSTRAATRCGWRATHEFPRHAGRHPPDRPVAARPQLPRRERQASSGSTSRPPTAPCGRAPRRSRDAAAMFYTPKADGAYLAGGSKSGGAQVAEIDIRNPHPEVTPRSLFGKVWYEGYAAPAWVWQSSGGSDDFEPKLSLTPLLVGTLKGTFYSLLLAIPLGVFGAMYISQFMHPAYKRYVKPMIEIMASLPSVVLGFLAGLWLAPRIERVVPALVLMAVALPLFVLLAGFLWSRLPRAFRGRFPVGTEALLFVFVLAGGAAVCLRLSPGFERLAFAGDFKTWLLNATGLGFDQRNAVVVGLAMGFAVIPIIFAIAEDAFSNVPANLVAGSLALGADRWQTVTRVVLPSASPGIFSAIMIGFGRAVGETMIVLMATGNTPIMDWNPFNGFRTLSANIAVEIPEAPHGGTLYRTLFLAGLLLFVMTFLINTVAEIVRQRLRERYTQI